MENYVVVIYVGQKTEMRQSINRNLLCESA